MAAERERMVPLMAGQLVMIAEQVGRRRGVGDAGTGTGTGAGRRDGGLWLWLWL